MNRMIMLLVSVLGLGLSGASLAVEPSPSPATIQAKLETRLSEARALLARSGIIFPLQGDPAAIQPLAAALEAWVSDPSDLEPSAAEECFADNSPASVQGRPLSPDLFLPSQSARLGRSLGFTLELQDLADTYLVEDQGTVQRLRNPDSYTPKATISFKPGDLSLSTADYAQAFLVANKFAPDFPFTNNLAAQKRVLDTFESSIRNPQRLLNMMSFSFSVSRRPELDGTTRIPRTVLEEDRSATTWGIKIDPYLYYNSLSSRSSAYDSLLTYGKTFGGTDLTPGRDLCDLAASDPDSPVLHACLKQLSQTSSDSLFAAAWLPIVEYQSIDQQDFIRSGQAFLQSDEESLWSVKLTWDLTRALGIGKAREQALAILKNDRALRTGMPIIQTSELPNARIRSFYYQRLVADGGLAGLSWGVDVPAGKKVKCALPGVELTSEGLLIGEPLKPGYYRFDVIVTDSLKRQSKRTMRVYVEGGAITDLRRSLMKKYIELAASPSLAEDDAWFEDLSTIWGKLEQEEPRRRPREIASSSKEDKGGDSKSIFFQ